MDGADRINLEETRRWLKSDDAWTGDTDKTARVAFLLRLLDRMEDDRKPLVDFGWFRSHSGVMLPYKIDCDALSDSTIEGLARVIRERFRFSDVYGIPRGGDRIADALAPHTEEGFPPLVVDDVLTTGRSMEEAKEKVGPNPVGVSIFSRTPYTPDWVWPMFRVEEWTQVRATGLG